MHLNILWNNISGAKEAAENKHLLPANISLKVATELKDAQKLLNWTNILVAGNPDESLLDGSSLLHVIVPYVGIHKDLQKNILARPHLKLYNSHFNDDIVAQHAVAMLLACSNLIIEADKHIKSGDWQWGTKHNSIGLNGKNCLLLGYGAIAKQIEKSVRALGMNISIVKRNMTHVENAKVYLSKDLNIALENADVIMVSLPGTSETINMLDDTAFQNMKKTAIIVNVGRGEVINQFALYKALKNKEIFAAGVDVLWNYPKSRDENCLPSEAPLYELDNIVMSSHRASHIENWQLVAFKDVLKTIQAIIKGETRNLVDVEIGY